MPTLTWACWKVTDIMESNNLIRLIAEDDGSGLYRFIPFIIIMILYSLSSLLKNQEKKQQKRPQPKPKSTRREETLPTYARRKPQQPAGATAGRPKPAPRTPQPVTGKKPAPSAPRPRPVPSRRPAQPAPTPIEIIPEPVARRSQPIPAPSAQRKTPPKPSHTTHRPTELGHAKDRARLKQQMPPTVEVVEPKSTTRQEEKKPATARKDLASDRLDLALGQKNVLVRAIVYAEILGKPIGLKSKGGYELK